MIMMADSEVNWAAMPLSGVFETHDGALVLVGAFKANPLRDICAALEIADLLAGRALRRPRSAVRAQGRAARDLPRALRDQHARALAGPARGAGPALRAGARHARGAGRPADAAQRDDPRRRARRRPTRCSFIASPIHMSGAPARTAPRAAEARRAHRRGAGRSAVALSEEVGVMSVRLRGRDHVATVTIDRPEVLNAVDLADRGRAAAHLGRHRAARRRARGGADRRRRARLLRRRRHEEHRRPQGRRVLGGAAARRLRRHRAARDAERAGDRARQRLRARRRLRDGARLRHRRRLRRSQLRPARAAGRAPAARRRHDAAAAPDPVPPGDGHDADRAADQGAPRRSRWASSTRSCRAPSSTPRSTRWVAADPGLRAAVAAGDQAGGAPHRAADCARGPGAAPAGAGRGAQSEDSRKACAPSSRSASRSGRDADAL